MGKEFDSGEIGGANSLSVDFIKAAVDQYRTNQLQCTEENLGLKDAHSIWFDLPTLKKFIRDIETLAQSTDPSSADTDLGVRMYYAAYPEDFENSELKEEYRKCHTLIMIPTKKDSSGDSEIHRDFNPMENHSDHRLALATTNTMAQNHGSLSPPNSCDGELY